MSVKLVVKGNFKKTERFLERLLQTGYKALMLKYAQEGVEALSAATPKDTGETANSWYFKIHEEKNSLKITWTNDHIEKGVNIAIVLQYGHATRNGGWVEGVDYINPAIRPIFEKMAKAAWKEVVEIGKRNR